MREHRNSDTTSGDSPQHCFSNYHQHDLLLRADTPKPRLSETTHKDNIYCCTLNVNIFLPLRKRPQYFVDQLSCHSSTRELSQYISNQLDIGYCSTDVSIAMFLFHTAYIFFFLFFDCSLSQRVPPIVYQNNGCMLKRILREIQYKL